MRQNRRIIGTQNFYNSSTGEIVEMQLVESDTPEKDSNFHKLFLKNFEEALKKIVNKKTSLCFWILSHLTKDNLLLYTYREIADKTDTSYKTVADTMQQLLNSDFLRKHSSGYYMVNPDIIFKGSYQRRCIAYKTFSHTPYSNIIDNDETRLKEVQRTISRLQSREKKLQAKIERTNSLSKNDGEEPSL